MSEAALDPTDGNPSSHNPPVNDKLAVLLNDLRYIIHYMMLGVVTISSHFAHETNVWTIQGPKKNPVVILRYQNESSDPVEFRCDDAVKVEPSDEYVEGYQSTVKWDDGTHCTMKGCDSSYRPDESRNVVTQTLSEGNSDSDAVGATSLSELAYLCAPEIGTNSSPARKSEVKEPFFDAFIDQRQNLEDNSEAKESLQEMKDDDCATYVSLSEIGNEDKNDNLTTKPKVAGQCKYCFKMFYNSLILKMHEKSHSGIKEEGQETIKESDETHKCAQCQRTFSQFALLKHHELCHAKEKIFKCPHCDKKFSTAKYLRRHKRIHSKVRPHECSTCNKKFITSQYLRIHLRVHTRERPYQCPYCEMSFMRASHLKRHELRHTGEKPYKCPSCELCFSRVEHLKRHERTHANFNSEQTEETGNSSSRQVETMVVKQEPNICLPLQLSENVQDDEQADVLGSIVQMEERPYRCFQCEKRFTRLTHLKRHERVHTGERPFNCPHCEKTFSRSEHLKRHEAVHAEEKVYKCLVCNLSFTQSNYLKQHEKIHVRQAAYALPVPMWHQ